MGLASFNRNRIEQETQYNEFLETQPKPKKEVEPEGIVERMTPPRPMPDKLTKPSQEDVDETKRVKRDKEAMVKEQNKAQKLAASEVDTGSPNPPEPTPEEKLEPEPTPAIAPGTPLRTPTPDTDPATHTGTPVTAPSTAKKKG